MHPDYAQNGWLYLSYSEARVQSRTSMTKIVRGRIKDGAWVEQQTIWEANSRYYGRGDDHYTLAISPLEFSTSPRFPGWQNQFLMGTLKAEQPHRLKIEDGRVVEEEILLENAGRIRDVATSPDGLIYLAIDYYYRPGDIVRLVPVND